MSIRALKGMVCSVLVAAGVLVAAPAQSRIIYDVGYDPDNVFVGHAQFAIDASCLNEDGTFTSGETCQIDLLSASMLDSGGNNWSSGPQSNIANDQTFEVVDGNLFAFDSNVMFLSLNPILLLDLHALADVSCDASGGLQMFLDRSSTFNGCNGQDSATYVITRAAPEPGTSLLILGGLAAGWIGRRRRQSH